MSIDSSRSRTIGGSGTIIRTTTARMAAGAMVEAPRPATGGEVAEVMYS